MGRTDQVGVLGGPIQSGVSLGAWKDKLMEPPERLREAYVAVSQGWPRTPANGRHVNAPAHAPTGFAAGN